MLDIDNAWHKLKAVLNQSTNNESTKVQNASVHECGLESGGIMANCIS